MVSEAGVASFEPESCPKIIIGGILLKVRVKEEERCAPCFRYQSALIVFQQGKEDEAIQHGLTKSRGHPTKLPPELSR